MSAPDVLERRRGPGVRLSAPAFTLPADPVIDLALNRHLAFCRLNRLSTVGADEHAAETPSACSLGLPGLKARSVKPYRLAGRQIGLVLHLSVRDRLITAVAGTEIARADPHLARRISWERQPACGNLRPDAAGNVRIHRWCPQRVVSMRGDVVRFARLLIVSRVMIAACFAMNSSRVLCSGTAALGAAALPRLARCLGEPERLTASARTRRPPR